MKNNSTERDFNDYDLDEEYDLAQMPVMPKGRYAPDRRVGHNVAILEPDVAKAFPSDKAVNDALRLVLQIARIPQPQDFAVTS